MRICYLCQDVGISLDGTKGASAHLRGFLRAAKALGHEIAVVTCSDNDAGLAVPVFSIPKTRFLEFSGIEGQPRLLRALSHTCNNTAAEHVLEEVIESFRPDLIYERYSPFAVAGGAIARRNGIPLILEVNAMLAEEGKVYRRQALQEVCELLEQTALRNASLIITVSEELRRALMACGVEAQKMATVPNGVDEMFFAPARRLVRDDLTGKTVVGFVGSLKPWHAIDLLAASFRELAHDPSFHLLIVGDGPMRKITHALAKELPGRVSLAGAVRHEDVPAYIKAMDIAVAPYQAMEMFYYSPLKVFEYMACGRAIIAAEIGQLKELLRHGETGWLVPPGDTESLTEAIRTLAADADLRTMLGQNAANEARKRHTWEQRVDRILDLFMQKKAAEMDPVLPESRI